MSVVNQMLKDLEQRQADEHGVSAVYQPSSKSKQVPLSWVIVIVLLLLMAGMVGWYLHSNQTHPSVKEHASQSEQQTLVTEVANAKPMAVKTDPEAEQQEQLATVEPIDGTVLESVTTTVSDAMLEPAENAQIAPEPVAVQVSEMPVNIRSDDEVVVETPSAFSKQSATGNSDASSLRDRAQAAVRSGQDELAIQLLEQLIVQEPTNTAARKKLAALLFAQGQVVRARVVLDAGVQLYPQDASMRLMLARLLEQQQQTQAAFAILNPEGTLTSINAEYLGVRAAMADQLGEYAIAFEDYMRLTQLQPEQARWWLGLAISSERVGASAQALAAYQQAASMNQLSRDVQRFVQQRISLLVGAQ
ncbi:tetratricopeptide repeat protein [Alteromonas sp. ASW11-36]|uniref:Tetratricopeptide repeat protein n=1 Tax=Alteromonas arenosi TaxID=3055817 RepID=A0ABT7ST27_9ALTE|nr:tetratricopeptide repeat protein [Alteromonas sp. ASW11-36]MDM7859144.1 tetratricopeptide repeat protein [Alteromonas sp. ASW11-36]